MCKVTSIHVPILLDDELHEIPSNVENVEREEDSDCGSNIVILLCATILAFYMMSGMPCGCSFPTVGVGPSSRSVSLRGAAFMMTITDAGVEDSDEHLQAPHRRPHSLVPAHVQFILGSDSWHQLSSSDTDVSRGSYSSDSDSDDNEQEEWLEGREDDDVDISEEDPNLTETLTSRRSINYPLELLQSEIDTPSNNVDESLSGTAMSSGQDEPDELDLYITRASMWHDDVMSNDNMLPLDEVDSSPPSDNLVEMSYVKAEIMSASE